VVDNLVVPSGLEPGRPLRNCPVGNFREERDCRGGLLIQNQTCSECGIILSLTSNLL